MSSQAETSSSRATRQRPSSTSAPSNPSAATFNVSDNGPCTSVVIGALLTVAGNLTLESCGTGAFSLGSAAVGGDAAIDTGGYTAVDGTTATGATTISNATPDARLTVHLPARQLYGAGEFLCSRASTR